jgi:hypothetical protein
VGWFRALGSAAIPVVAGAILAYWAWRIIQKRRILRALRCRRLTPDALRLRLQSGDPVRILDLRTSIAYESSRQTLPGAIRLDPEELDTRHTDIPRDRDIVPYCTCPNETTSARVARPSKSAASSACFHSRAASRLGYRAAIPSRSRHPGPSRTRTGDPERRSSFRS